MNTETGAIYRSDVEIEMARRRGEPLVEISQEQADAIEAVKHCCEAHHLAVNRAQRRAADKTCPGESVLADIRSQLAGLGPR